MSELYTRFDNVFFEKTRLSMMTLLYREGEVSFNRFKTALGTSDGAIYGHLNKLLGVDYISSRKMIIGTSLQTIYTLTDQGKILFEDYLNFLRDVVEK